MARGPRIRVGDRLGRYTVQDFLGRGGMGRVYRAMGPEGAVALKLIHPQFLRKDDFLRRLMLEAGAGKRVLHPNVVRTFGIELVPHGGVDQAMLVMEYVPGRTLLSLQMDLGSVPDAFLRDIAIGVARGLEAIHDAGVIHRDLKPENVMLTADHQVKIMDLGVARLEDDEIRLSRTGHFVGSLLFAAPEQLSRTGLRCGPAADLYALGLLLYVLATGEHPFPTGTAGEIINAHLHTRPPPLRAKAPDASPFLEAVLRTLLEKEPGRRFASAAHLRETLESAESSEWWTRQRQPSGAPAPSGASLDVRRQGPMRGRPAELRDLIVCWRQARLGKGRLVLLEGERGLGKTRLVDAFLEGVGLPPGVLGIGDCEGPPHAPFRASLRELLAEDDPGAIFAASPEWADGARALLDEQAGLEPPAGTRLRDITAALVAAACQSQPRCLVLEDLHTLHPDAWDAFEALARAATRLPLLIVATCRPELDERLRDRVLRVSRVRLMTLDPLDGADQERVLADLVQSDTLADDLASRVLSRVGGNPLFLTTLVDGFKASGALVQSASGRWACGSRDALAQVPGPLERLLQDTLEPLDDEARALLDAAVVQGPSFDAELVAQVLGLSDARVRAVLARLEDSPALVARQGMSYLLVPPVLRDILLAAMDRSAREGLHARTADALAARHAGTEGVAGLADAAALARHRLRAGQPEAAAPILTEALSHLTCTYAHEEAVALADEALARRSAFPADLVLEIMTVRAQVLECLGRRDEEREALEALRTFAQEHGLPVAPECLDAHGRLLLADGRLDAAEKIFRGEMEAARGLGRPDLRARALRNLGSVARRRGDRTEARRHLERALREARAGQVATEELACHEALGIFFESIGADERATLHQARRLDQAGRLGDLRQSAGAHGGLSRMSLRWGRFRDAQVHLDRQLHLARQVGDQANLCRAWRGLGRLQMARGRVLAAAEAFEHAERVARNAGRELDVASIWVDQADLALLRGEPLGLNRLSMRALSKAQRIGVVGLEVAALTLAGVAALERQDADEALDWYQQALDVGRGRLYAGGEIPALLGMARAGRALGARDTCDLSLGRVVQLADALDLPGPRVLAEALRAATFAGPAAPVLRRLVLHVDRMTLAERLEVLVELADLTGDMHHGEDARSLLGALAGDLGVSLGRLAAGRQLYRRIPGTGAVNAPMSRKAAS